MNVEELKEATLQAIRQTYEETGRSSSLKSLFKKVDGLNNRSFYLNFKSVEQAHKLAGVPYDKSRKDKMKKVRERKETKSTKNAKIKKQNDSPPALSLMDPRASEQIPEEIMKYLYDIQGVLGASSIVDAVERAYRVVVSIAKLKVTHWKLYSSADEVFTGEAMVQYLLNNDDHQKATLNKTRTELRDAENEILKRMDDADYKYDEGFEKAREDGWIYAQCAYCGEPFQVMPRGEVHRFVKQTLLKDGWGHEHCVNQT